MAPPPSGMARVSRTVGLGLAAIVGGLLLTELESRCWSGTSAAWMLVTEATMRSDRCVPARRALLGQLGMAYAQALALDHQPSDAEVTDFVGIWQRDEGDSCTFVTRPYALQSLWGRWRHPWCTVCPEPMRLTSGSRHEMREADLPWWM